MTRRRVRLLLEAAGLLIAIGGLALLLGFISDHPRNNIRVRIPWRPGVVDQDPHWWTSFANLGLGGLQDLMNLPPADPALDPWANASGIPYLFLKPEALPDDSSPSWSVAIGHGLVRVRVGEDYSLYADILGLEDRLLRQGIEHGYLEDMQRIYAGRHDLSELATVVAIDN